MTDLSDLLRAASADAPHDRFDVTTVIDTGRHRIRRRRAFMGAAAIVVAGAVVAGSIAVTGHHRAVGPAHEPPAPVLRLTDVRTATPGSDFTMVRTEHHPNTQLAAVLTDGRLLLSSGSSEHRQWQVSDGSGAHELRTTVKGPLIGQDGNRLLFGPPWSDKDTHAPYQLVDLATGKSSPASSGSDPGYWDGSTQEQVIADGSLYTAAGSGATLQRLPLGGSWEATKVKVGAFSVLGTTLAWTDDLAADSSTVSVRVGDGAVHTFADIAPGPGCRTWSLALTTDRILVGSYCSRHSVEGGTINRLDVYTYAGKPVVTYTGKMALSDMEGGPVTLFGGDESASAYVFKDDTLLRLPDSTDASRFRADSFSAAVATGQGLLAWAQPGGTYAVARLR